jgi:pilus assembly protein TadC
VNTTILIGAALVLFGLLAAGILAYSSFVSSKSANYRNLMTSTMQSGSVGEVRERLRNDETGEEANKIKQELRKGLKKKTTVTLDEKFFQAGMFVDDEKREFKRIRIIAPVITIFICGFLFSYLAGADLFVIGVLLGAIIGYQIPFSILDRRIKARNEEILFYLPLVIEQISIGVSSSLDISPCLQKVVSMADERDSHNVVTELIRLTTFYVKSGASLEEALTEIGKLSGNTELKHAFLSLAQVAKHGGEVTRQLQELADAVAMQRETKIEEKIKKLELEATAPVALVFVGFLIILLTGFGLQMQGF